MLTLALNYINGSISYISLTFTENQHKSLKIAVLSFWLLILSIMCKNPQCRKSASIISLKSCLRCRNHCALLLLKRDDLKFTISRNNQQTIALRNEKNSFGQFFVRYTISTNSFVSHQLTCSLIVNDIYS